jgi:hypothetical protein
MASPSPAPEVFGQMKKQNSSSSRNEEWPGARKHRTWLRWSAALTLGLAVAAGVSIPLEEIGIPKINASSEENALATPITEGNSIGEVLQSDSSTPFSEPQPTSGSSGEIQRKWDIDTNIPNQEPAVESSTLPTEAQGAARRENATPDQGSDNSIGGGSADIRTSPQQAMLEMPQAPAVGRIPPVRPSPTPIPTPPPIRSPQ